jgi:cell division protein FtsQ
MWRRQSWLYGLGTLLLGIGLIGYRILKYHPFFQVERIDLVVKTQDTKPRLTYDRLFRYTQGIAGSIWFVRIHELVKLFGSLDWVEHVSVSRIFPNIIRIELKEREPIALWSDGRILTRDNRLIEASQEDRNWVEQKHLMSIYGPESSSERLVLWQTMISREMSQVGLSLNRMRSDFGGSLFLDVCTLGDVGRECRLEIVLPVDENLEKMRQYIRDAMQILRVLARQGQKVVKIDLRYPTGAAVVLSGGTERR